MNFSSGVSDCRVFAEQAAKRRAILLMASVVTRGVIEMPRHLKHTSRQGQAEPTVSTEHFPKDIINSSSGYGHLLVPRTETAVQFLSRLFR